MGVIARSELGLKRERRRGPPPLWCQGRLDPFCFTPTFFNTSLLNLYQIDPLIDGQIHISIFRFFLNFIKMDIFGSSESVFINDKRIDNQVERVKKWKNSLEVLIH